MKKVLIMGFNYDYDCAIVEFYRKCINFEGFKRIQSTIYKRLVKDNIEYSFFIYNDKIPDKGNFDEVILLEPLPEGYEDKVKELINPYYTSI